MGISGGISRNSKNKYQTRYNQRKTIIENSDSSIKYLMDLVIPSDNLLEDIEQKHSTQVDRSKLSKIFLKENFFKYSIVKLHGSLSNML